MATPAWTIAIVIANACVSSALKQRLVRRIEVDYRASPGELIVAGCFEQGTHIHALGQPAAKPITMMTSVITVVARFKSRAKSIAVNHRIAAAIAAPTVT